MPMHLVSHTGHPADLDHNAISRLRYSARCPSARNGRGASLREADYDTRHPSYPGANEPDPHPAFDYAPHGPGPDHVADRAQAELEDIALVKLAASKLAVALRDVSLLLRGDRGSRRSEALARCILKGWITVQGDAFAAGQTFRVTPEGYRAAGLRVPPFSA